MICESPQRTSDDYSAFVMDVGDVNDGFYSIQYEQSEFSTLIPSENYAFFDSP